MDRRTISSWVVGAMLVGSWPHVATAAERVQFDVQSLVECRDVTPPEFTRTNPEERLVAATFPVSVLSRLAADQSLREIWVRIESPDASLHVEDYSPRTTLTSNVAGSKIVQGESTRDRQWNFHVRGGYLGFADGEAQGSMHETDRKQYQFEELPPTDLVTASGTILRGRGVFFKFCAGPRTSLEGERLLEVVFRVPLAWRGDRVFVHCEAIGSDPGYAIDNRSSALAARSFVVALCQEGNRESRRLAEQYLAAESLLRASYLRSQSRSKNASAGWQDLRELFSAGPRRAPNWAEQLIYSRTSGAQVLPEGSSETVREAASRYLAASAALEHSAKSPTTAALTTAPPTARFARTGSSH